MADYADDRLTDTDRAGSCPRCSRPAVKVSGDKAECSLGHPWRQS